MGFGASIARGHGGARRGLRPGTNRCPRAGHHVRKIVTAALAIAPLLLNGSGFLLLAAGRLNSAEAAPY